MINISGLDFFKLPRSRAWYRNLIINILGALALISFIIGAFLYDNVSGQADPEMRFITPLTACGIFIFLNAVAICSAGMCHAVHVYRGVHSMCLRMNSIITFFVALLYTFMSAMQYNHATVRLGAPDTYSYICLIPYVALVMLKIYIGCRLIRRHLPRTGAAVLVFWTLTGLTSAVLLTGSDWGRTHIINGFTGTMLILTGLAGINMLLRYTATTIIIACHPEEYREELDNFKKDSPWT